MSDGHDNWQIMWMKADSYIAAQFRVKYLKATRECKPRHCWQISCAREKLIHWFTPVAAGLLCNNLHIDIITSRRYKMQSHIQTQHTTMHRPTARRANRPMMHIPGFGFGCISPPKSSRLLLILKFTSSNNLYKSSLTAFWLL